MCKCGHIRQRCTLKFSGVTDLAQILQKTGATTRAQVGIDLFTMICCYYLSNIQRSSMYTNDVLMKVKYHNTRRI